jgi:hypothetical protein
MADPGDSVEVTDRVPVTISNLNISWFIKISVLQFYQSNKKTEGFQNTFKYRTAIFVLLTLPKTELPSWKHKQGSNSSLYGRTRIVDYQSIFFMNEHYTKLNSIDYRCADGRFLSPRGMAFPTPDIFPAVKRWLILA